MKRQLKYVVDYRKDRPEIKEKRKCKVFDIINQNKIVGKLEIEPEDYAKRYRFWDCKGNFNQFEKYGQLAVYVLKNFNNNL